MPSTKPAKKHAPEAGWPEAIGNPSGCDSRTDEFSFILRASAHGVGVFAAHRIQKGVTLRLYSDEVGALVSIRVRQDEVPGEFIKYCIPCPEPDWVWRPADFTRMDLVWFLNHDPHPSAAVDAEYCYTALKDIAPGEEITIDYASL
jgi:SET domain-containing protein